MIWVKKARVISFFRGGLNEYLVDEDDGVNAVA